MLTNTFWYIGSIRMMAISHGVTVVALLVLLCSECIHGAGYSPFTYGSNVPGMEWYSAAKFGVFPCLL